MNLHSSVLAALTLYNLPDRVVIAPDICPGPFVFVEDHADAANTTMDLTAFAGLTSVDKQWENVFGLGSDPDVNCLFTAIKVEVMAPLDVTKDDLQSTLSGIYLQHAKSGRDEYFELGPAVGTYLADGATDTTTAAATRDRATRRASVYKFPHPLFVEMRTDIFALTQRSGLTGANKLFVTLFGTAWKASLGSIPIVAVTDQRSALAHVGAARAQAGMARATGRGAITAALAGRR